MLPRPRLVCQEPGLRPIGRSPGVPDKSSRDLNLFYSILFPFFFIPLWVWLGTLQDCQYAQCPLPLSIVIRMRLAIRQLKLPACLAEVQLDQENSLAFMPQDWWNWQIKWMKSVSMGSFQYMSQVNEEFFAYLWVIFAVFQHRIWTDFRDVGSLLVVLKI